MTSIGRLNHVEAVRLDPERVIALFRDLGPVGAEAVLTRAIGEITHRHAGLCDPHRSGRWAELARRAGTLRAIADQVGMSSLARVAGDVAECAARADAPALAATLGRLERIVDQSLAAMWDLQGIGG